MNIILIGFKNSGKTTVGYALSIKFNCPFVDTDKILRELYTNEKKEELSVPEIYQREGESSFRLWENKAITQIHHLDNHIISIGGGCVLYPENVTLLKAMGKLVYLKATKNELLKRQKKNRVPAFLDEHHLEKSFDEMFIKRQPIYEKIADYIINIDHKHAPEVVTEIAEQLGDQFHGK